MVNVVTTNDVSEVLSGASVSTVVQFGTLLGPLKTLLSTAAFICARNTLFVGTVAELRGKYTG